MATLLNISKIHNTSAHNVCKAIILYTTGIEFIHGDDKFIVDSLSDT